MCRGNAKKETEEEEANEELMLFTQIKDQKEATSTTTTSTSAKLAFPLQAPVDNVGEYKISPTIHAGYAATWFGLSGAGLVMTRKLFTRGR